MKADGFVWERDTRAVRSAGLDRSAALSSQPADSFEFLEAEIK